MELWIRSQDKEVLSKVNNLCYYTREDVLEFIKEEELKKDIQHIIWSPDGSILGYYKTKERAIEVLDEIQSRLDDFVNSDYLKNVTDVSKQVYIAPFIVYEMPKE